MESPPPEKQTVRVTILNRQYTLRAAGDPRDIERAAARYAALGMPVRYLHFPTRHGHDAFLAETEALAELLQ